MFGVSIVLLILCAVLHRRKGWGHVRQALFAAAITAAILGLNAMRSTLLVMDWPCVVLLCAFFVSVLTQAALWAYIFQSGERRLLTGSRRKAKNAIEQIDELHPWILILFAAYTFAAITEHIIGAFK